MLNRTRIYLDTSVISFLFADDAPDKKDITVEFFRDFIRPSVYDVFVSEFVLAEIENNTNEDRKQKMLKVVNDYPIEFLSLQNRTELDELAAKYVSEGIIPAKKILDAYHIAVSVTNQINILVSWNYRHLANINRERKINVVNLANNYLNELRIVTPYDLMDYEN